MLEGIINVFGLLLWAFIITAGIICFTYPLFSEEGEEEKREKGTT